MARLPQPGADSGNWGEILNDYLSQSHQADGTLRDNIVTSATLANGSVTTASLAPGAVTAGALANNSVDASAIADGTIAEAKLSSGVQAKLNQAPVIADGSVPEAKLDATLQTKIDGTSTKAASSVQTINAKSPNSYGAVTLTASDIGAPTTLAGLTDTSGILGATNNQVLTYNGTTTKWAPGTVSSTTISDATNGAKGILQLAGDLGGTAAMPTVPALANKLDITTAANTYLSQNNAAGTYATKASPTFTGTVTIPANPANNTDAASKTYVDATIAAAVSGTSTPDATTNTKGTVQLAGDLNGTAANPQVTNTHLAAALPISQGGTGSSSQNFVDVTNDQTVSGNKIFSASLSTPALKVTGGTPATGKVLTSDNSGNASWQTAASAGSTVVGGDLSGTVANATVSKLNGVTVTGTPSNGTVLTATTSSAATWSAVSAGLNDPTTTKGDLIIHGTSTTRLAIGNDGEVLTADSTQSTGAKWTAPAATDTTKLAIANNLSDLANTSAARSNLGLGNVNNTADSAKPVSTAQATAIAAKASLLFTQAVSSAASGTLTTDTINPIDATTAAANRSLPTPTIAGQIIVIEKVDATTNTVVISGTIRGTSSSITLYWQYETVEFVAESLTSWRPIAGHKTKSALDAAYLNVLGTPSNPVTNASATRPTGLTRVYWLCSTQPTNWINGDEWINNS